MFLLATESFPKDKSEATLTVLSWIRHNMDMGFLCWGLVLPDDSHLLSLWAKKRMLELTFLYDSKNHWIIHLWKYKLLMSSDLKNRF